MASAYGAKALANEAAQVASTQTNGRNNQLVRSAFAMGQLTASGDLDRDEIETTLLDAAIDCGLGEREAIGTIRSGLEAGAAKPRPQKQQRQGKPGQTNQKPKQEKPKPAAVCPVPGNVPLPDCRYKGQLPSFIVKYHDQNGGLLCLRARYEDLDANGQPVLDKNGKPGKSFRPWIYTGKKWEAYELPKPLPLYSLPALATLPSDGNVLLLEGERKTDKTQTVLGPTWAVVSLHGGTSAAMTTDFAQLAGKVIYYWPDKDKVGIEAALKVLSRLRSIASAVFVIMPPLDKPESWDCGNAVEEGWDKERIENFIIANRLNPDDFVVYARETWQCESKRESNDKPVFQAINIGEFIAMDIPEREFIIDPILQRQGLAMIHASRGMGKTFAALCIAYAAASGGNAFGWHAPKPARVLFIDGEMPARDMQNRIIKIAAKSEKAIENPDFFKLITPDLYPLDPMPNLATPEGQASVEAEVEKADVIIIDNLATLCRYGRSNEEESWQPMQEWLRDLRRRGKSVIVIHHSGKNGNQRGTSAKEDILDTVIDLRRPPDYEPEQGARFEVHITKGRSIKDDDAKPFEAWLQNDFTWRISSVEDSKKERLKELYDSGMTNNEIAEELGVSKATFYRLKKDLGLTKNPAK